MDQRMNILFGFDDRKIENSVLAYLKSKGVVAASTVKLTKTSIRDFLQQNEDYNCAVLLEVLNGARDKRISRFSAEELAELTDDRDINIVVITDEAHKGQEFMQILYGANITSAIYQKGKKGGATPKDIGELLMHKRSRKDAREYYAIAENITTIDFLGNDTFKELYNKLFDEELGETLIDRFLKLCTYMNQDQLADFIRRLPEEILTELSPEARFQEICEMVRDGKIPIRPVMAKRVSSDIPGKNEKQKKGGFQVLRKQQNTDEKKIEEDPDEKPSREQWRSMIKVVALGVAISMIIIGIYISGIIPYMFSGH